MSSHHSSMSLLSWSSGGAQAAHGDCGYGSGASFVNGCITEPIPAATTVVPVPVLRATGGAARSPGLVPRQVPCARAVITARRAPVVLLPAPPAASDQVDIERVISTPLPFTAPFQLPQPKTASRGFYAFHGWPCSSGSLLPSACKVSSPVSAQNACLRLES